MYSFRRALFYPVFFYFLSIFRYLRDESYCNEKEVGTFEPTSLLKENIFLYTFFFDTGFLASKFA